MSQFALPPTKSVGTKTVLHTVRDASGNASTKLCQYQVQYSATGQNFNGQPTHQILQPVNADGTSVFKQGSTVAAKFRVLDAQGNSIGTAGVISSFRLIQTMSGTVSDVDESVDSSTPDTAFRWDGVGQQWIFNISTKNLSANVKYTYRITLNDGTHIDFMFALK